MSRAPNPTFLTNLRVCVTIPVLLYDKEGIDLQLSLNEHLARIQELAPDIEERQEAWDANS